MATLTRSREPGGEQPAQARRRLGARHPALVVVTVVALGLAAIATWDRTTREGPSDVPTAVDDVLERFVTAMEENAHALLRTVVTPGFRRTFYQGDDDGSPWRDVWWLERYEFWDTTTEALVDWRIERGDRPIVQGSGPWFVSESQIWRNTAAGVQYEGVATFVVIETAGAVEIDDAYWAAQPRPLELESLEAVTSEGTRVDFVDWLMERFLAAGLTPPDATVVWLPPSLDCPATGSFARQSDTASGLRHSVTLCLDEPDLLLGEDVDGRWSRTAARSGLHEFAHVWMYSHLHDDEREAFVERAGLEEWRGDRAWNELGVEHAAETIAWGLAGSDAAWYRIEPEPSCDELTQRFALLTGRAPLTSCTTPDGR